MSACTGSGARTGTGALPLTGGGDARACEDMTGASSNVKAGRLFADVAREVDDEPIPLSAWWASDVIANPESGHLTDGICAVTSFHRLSFFSRNLKSSPSISLLDAPSLRGACAGSSSDHRGWPGSATRCQNATSRHLMAGSFGLPLLRMTPSQEPGTTSAVPVLPFSAAPLLLPSVTWIQ